MGADGKPTFRPPAGWYLAQLDCRNALSFQVVDAKVMTRPNHADDLCCAVRVEGTFTEHKLDHLRLGLQLAKLHQLDQQRFAIPLVHLTLALISIGCILSICRRRLENRGEQLPNAVQNQDKSSQIKSS